MDKGFPPLRHAEIRNWQRDLFFAMVLLLTAAGLKGYLGSKNPKIKGDGVNLFWAESAIQFYYARLISEAKEVPDIDKRAQYPEGFPVKESLTMGIEYVTGGLYRFLGIKNIPFHRFLLLMVYIYSSIGIIAFYFCCNALWRSRSISVILTISYLLFPQTYIRSLSNFVKEDLALPFLFLWLLGQFLFEWNRKASIALIVSGLSLGMILWHVSPFFLYMALIVYTFLWIRDYDRKNLSLLLLLNFLLILFLSIVYKPFRLAELYISPLAIGFGVLALAVFLEKRFLIKTSMYSRIGIGLSVLVLSYLASNLLRSNAETYSHVFELFIAKLRHLGSKPVNPSDLSVNARLLWLTPFVSPTPLNLLYYWFIPIILAIAGIKELLRRLTLYQASWLGIGFVVSLVSFFFVYRLAPIFAFFLILSLGGFALRYSKYVYLIPIPFLLMTLTFTNIKTEPASELGLYLEDDDLKGVLTFFRNKTNEDDAVLGRFATSPSVLAYADRPIVLQPKFENTLIKPKVIRCYEGFFRDEESFYRLCKELNARYVLYEANMLLSTDYNSFRYLTDRLNVPSNAVIRQFHFDTGSLKYFRLVYESFFFRIFELAPDFRHKALEGKSPIFSSGTWGMDSPYSEIPTSRVNALLSNYQRAIEISNSGAKYLSKGDLMNAEKWFREAINLFPYLIKAKGNLSLVLFKTGRKKAAIELLYEIIRDYPNQYPPYFTLSMLLKEQGDYEASDKIRKRGEEIRALLE